MNKTQKLFAIRDTKAEVYHTPFAKNTIGEAERDFRTAANDDKTTISAYPEDFDLYLIGDYDCETGKLMPEDTPKHIMKAVACLQREEPSKPQVVTS